MYVCMCGGMYVCVCCMYVCMYVCMCVCCVFVCVYVCTCVCVYVCCTCVVCVFVFSRVYMYFILIVCVSSVLCIRFSSVKTKHSKTQNIAMGTTMEAVYKTQNIHITQKINNKKITCIIQKSPKEVQDMCNRGHKDVEQTTTKRRQQQKRK